MEQENQNVSIDAIKEAIANNKDLESQIVSLAIQTETGKTVLNTHLENSKGTIHSDATKTAYENVDKTLVELGFEKPAGKKTSEWVKDLVSDLNKTATSSKSTKAEKEEAEKMIESIQSKYNEEKTELLQQIESLKKQSKDYVVKSDLSSVDFEFDPNIPTEALEAFKSTVQGKLMSNYKEKDGKIVYYKDNGEPYLNDLLKPASAKEILADMYAPVLKKKSTPGGGAGKTSSSQMKGGTIVLDTNSFNTRVGFVAAFNKACVAQGIAKGSDDYYKQYDAAKETYKIDQLPES